MTSFCKRLAALSSVLFLSSTTNINAAELTYPPIMTSGTSNRAPSNWNIDITVEAQRFESDAVGFNTRMYCSTNVPGGQKYCGVPSPTLQVKPGDVVTIRMVNTLEPDDHGHVINTMHTPNTTNIHTHGLHIEGNSDNIFIGATGGENIRYQYTIHPDHHPGFHWYHAHVHGSATYQLHEGLLGALIVEPKAGLASTTAVYDKIPSSRVRLLMLHHFKFNNELGTGGVPTQACYDAGACTAGDTACVAGAYCNPTWQLGCTDANKASSEFSVFRTYSLIELAGEIGDKMALNPTYKLTGAPGDFYHVNGQYKPTITVNQYEPNIFRILNAVGDFTLDTGTTLLSSHGCTYQMIASDGVYLQTPRTITRLILVAAVRYEIQVTCSAAGTNIWSFTDMDTGTFATTEIFRVVVTASGTDNSAQAISTAELQAAYLERPAYLADLTGYSETLFQGTPAADKHYTHIDMVVHQSKKPATCSFWMGLGSDCSASDYGDVNNPGSTGTCVYRQFVGQGQGTGFGPSTPPSQYRLVTARGGITQWNIYGFSTPIHPMHIHVNHFQVISFTARTTTVEGELPTASATTLQPTFFAIGDYRDTIPAIDGLIKIRFIPEAYAGEIIVHCHFLRHEDLGMMDSFYVCDYMSGACDGVVPSSNPNNLPAAGTMSFVPILSNNNDISSTGGGAYSSSAAAFSSSDAPFSSSLAPFSSSQTPFSSSLAPFSSSQTSFSSSQTPFSSSQAPFSSSYSSDSSSQTPYSSSLKPFSSSQSAFSSSTTPFSSSLTPFSSSQTPFSSSRTPFSSSQTPFSSSQTPFSSSQTPFSSSQTPFSSSQTPFSSSQTPFSSSDTPFSSSQTPYSSSVTPFSSSAPPPGITVATVQARLTVEDPATFVTIPENVQKTKAAVLVALGNLPASSIANFQISDKPFPGAVLLSVSRFHLRATGQIYVKFDLVDPNQSNTALANNFVAQVSTPSSAFQTALTQQIPTAVVDTTYTPVVVQNVLPTAPTGDIRCPGVATSSLFASFTGIISLSSTTTNNTSFNNKTNTFTLLLPYGFSSPSFVPIYAPLQTPNTKMAVAYTTCQDQTCTPTLGQTKTTFICVSQEMCNLVGNMGYFTIPVVTPTIDRLVVRNSLVLTSYANEVMTYYIDVVFEGGPIVSSFATTTAAMTTSTASFVNSIVGSSVNMQNKTSAQIIQIQFYAGKPTMLPISAPFSTTGNPTTVLAVLYTNCIDNTCTPTAQTPSNTVYICVDLESCQTIAAAKSYFTLPTGQPGRNALDLTGQNGWVTRYYLDVVVNPSTPSPTTPAPTTMTPTTATPTTMAPTTAAGGLGLMGCYIDRFSPRTLPTLLLTSGSLTTLACRVAAQQAGFKYFGTQFGQQCWGGNVTPLEGTTNCNVACAGAANEICGGSYALTVYITVP